jgi:hypothetical protein
MTASRILSALMIALGVAAIAIGLSIFLYGASHTAQIAEWMYDRTVGGAAAPRETFGPIFESELRFYAPFWIVYGAILISTARNLPRRLGRVPGLSALFFAGGVGRALAWLQAGPPHPAFAMLMVSELILPLIFIILWQFARRV